MAAASPRNAEGNHGGDPDPREQEVARLTQAGALPEAEVLIKEILADRPNDAQLINFLGYLNVQQGRFVEAYGRFEKAIELTPGGAAAGNLAALKQKMAVDAFSHVERKDWPRALTAYREILAVEPNHTSAPNSIIHYVMATGDKPSLADYDPHLKEDELGQHIFIACMPKSGSTFLKLALCALSGWQEEVLTYAFLQNEEELYLPHLRAVARRNTVSQQHCRATTPNVQMMQAFGIRPIVLVRNLFDVVVSYTDFFDAGATLNTFFAGRWENFEREQRLDLMIDYFAPWYLTFFASWSEAIAKGSLDCHFLRYEDMIDDKQGTLERISAFHDLGKSASDCAATLKLVEAGENKDKTRFNKGKAGRGEELSDDQKNRVRALADYYHDIDFSPVGL